MGARETGFGHHNAHLTVRSLASSQSHTTAHETQWEAQHTKYARMCSSICTTVCTIACIPHTAHACKAARFTTRRGAHSRSARAGAPNEPTLPTRCPQPTSENLADTAALSLPISNDSIELVATAEDHDGAVSPLLRSCSPNSERGRCCGCSIHGFKPDMTTMYAVVDVAETSHGNAGWPRTNEVGL